MKINSYQIKKDHVFFYDEKNNFVRSIQASDVKSVNISPNGSIDIYRGDRRENYKNNLTYTNYYR
jgi:hypothetical protein